MSSVQNRWRGLSHPRKSDLSHWHISLFSPRMRRVRSTLSVVLTSFRSTVLSAVLIVLQVRRPHGDRPRTLIRYSSCETILCQMPTRILSSWPALLE